MLLLDVSDRGGHRSGTADYTALAPPSLLPVRDNEFSSSMPTRQLCLKHGENACYKFESKIELIC